MCAAVHPSVFPLVTRSVARAHSRRPSSATGPRPVRPRTLHLSVGAWLAFEWGELDGRMNQVMCHPSRCDLFSLLISSQVRSPRSSSRTWWTRRSGGARAGGSPRVRVWGVGSCCIVPQHGAFMPATRQATGFIPGGLQDPAVGVGCEPACVGAQNTQSNALLRACLPVAVLPWVCLGRP